MPIPKINLIPPAYYLRKKVKVAVAMALATILLETVALVAFALQQSALHERLVADRNTAQAQVDAVTAETAEADRIRTSVQEYTKKVAFVSSVFTGNAQWADTFENLATYTYPRAVLSSIKLDANSTNLTMQIRTDSQASLNRYWANLLRDPLVVAAVPNAMLGYPSQGGGNGGGGDIPVPGVGPMAGAPPMPGGAPPMPGGADTGYMGSPMGVAAPAMDGSQNALGQMSTVANGGIPPMPGAPGTMGMAPMPGMPGASGATVTAGPAMPYQFDITAEITKAVRPAMYGGAATTDATGGGLAPPAMGIPMPGAAPPMPGAAPPMPGGAPPMPGGAPPPPG